MSLHTQQQAVSPWQQFWDDQNKRLKALDSFRDDLGDINDDVLNFSIHSKGYNTQLDFSVFDLEGIDLKGVAQLTLEGEAYSLSLKEYAKLAVITVATPKNVQDTRKIYFLLVQLAGFLNMTASNVLDLDNVEAFHINVLTQKVSDKGWHTRLSPPSYRATYVGGNMAKLRMNLNALGVTGLISLSLSKKKWEKSLDNPCQSVLGMTRLEYMEGASFNALTLDMGQYYVDHLKRIYEQDYLYMAVCRATLRNIVLTSHKQKEVVHQTIFGTFKSKNPNLTKAKSLNEVHQELTSELYDQYVGYFDKVQFLKEDNICHLVQDLGLGMRFDAVEIIRVLMLQKYYDFDGGKTPESVWQGYLSSLDKSDLHADQINKVSIQDVYARMASIVAPQKLRRKEFIVSLNQWANSLSNGEEQSYKKLKAQFYRIEDAMTCLVTAWLGYRSSEFGFPLDAIYVHSNLDVLDNAHVPFRFKLKWIVPKTNDATKIDREITSQCYQVCAQLHDVLQPSEGRPCLYASRGNSLYKQTPNKSDTYIFNRIVSNWEHFAEHYQPFVDVHELERLSDMPMETLTPDEKDRLGELLASYDLSSAKEQHLLAASHEIKRDIMKLKCTNVLGKPELQKAFKASIKEYTTTGDITNPDHKFVVNTYLSNDTKQWLRDNGDSLDSTDMLNISNELLSGVRYPTPHAFRHIWAEAVLTRYQGDVGTVIRHQFCHLDDSFFMAYLRNKEAKGIVQAARMKVLNSVVDTLLIDAGKVGKEYLGGFARYVKKAVSLTDAVTQDKVRTLRDRIMGRVISISPSHFATCVPREGGEGRAKCAEMGDINPQNAKPSFCLGCTNAVITSGNLKGIWVTIQPFVKECLNDNVMGFMVQSHLPTLRSGYKRIKELKSEANAEQVNMILPYIEKAINSVEQKLKEEEGLYA